MVGLADVDLSSDEKIRRTIYVLSWTIVVLSCLNVVGSYFDFIGVKVEFSKEKIVKILQLVLFVSSISLFMRNLNWFLSIWVEQKISVVNKEFMDKVIDIEPDAFEDYPDPDDEDYSPVDLEFRRLKECKDMRKEEIVSKSSLIYNYSNSIFRNILLIFSVFIGLLYPEFLSDYVEFASKSESS